MEKTPFRYQRWYLKILLSGVMLFIAIPIQLLIAEWMKIEEANFWYGAICVISMLILLFAYYQCAQKLKWFVREGAYWVNDGVVYIQTKNKIYELKNVTWLRGTTVSAYGFSKSGMLVTQCGKKKVTLVSFSTKPIDNFSECDLLSLFETILTHNPTLKKDDTLDFWYEVKRELL